MKTRAATLSHSGVILFLSAFLLAGASAALGDTAPTIISQPDTAVLAGASDSGSFTAAAAGSPAPSVQWQYATDRRGPWTNIPGATSTTLNFRALPTLGSMFSLGNAFRAVFTNVAGTEVTRPAKLVWRAEWMHNLGSDIADVALNHLTIPGTHDMGTYGITDDSDDSADGQASNIGCSIDHDACLRFARAQHPSRNASAELDEGVRYFDLRVCGHSTLGYVTCHGLNAAPLDEILSQTRQWIDNHPYEVVILDLNHHFELDVDAEAAVIEQAFALRGGGSLLIPPQYCTSGDKTSGTCADLLTLGSIAAQSLGRVIVNFENDDAASSDNRQPLFGADFYDRHPLFWGRAEAQPSSFFRNHQSCTQSGAVLSCFGNDSDEGIVLDRVKDGVVHLLFSRLFQVQFLQTTPDVSYIASNFGSSLFQMAHLSNPLIGPALFGCDGSNSDCVSSEFRPENLNVLPINFYNDADYVVSHSIPFFTAEACRTGSGPCSLTPAEIATIECVGGNCYYFDPVRFDYVREIIRFDEYARTAPVVELRASVAPAATGWFNAAVLGGAGSPLRLNAKGSDYHYATGLTNFQYQDNSGAIIPLTQATSSPSVNTEIVLADGYHSLTYSATDGANQGVFGTGNSGTGPGSTAQPATFNVDTFPPTITCPSAQLILHQPNAAVAATVSDATSGPASASVAGATSTNLLGTFSIPLTASDVAGNSASTACSYTVSYGIALLYDSGKRYPATSLPIRISLLDYFGKNFSDKATRVTAVSVTNVNTGATFTPVATSNANARFTFIASPKGYLYALSLKGYTSGSYTLDFTAAGDPVVHHAPFLVR